MRGAATCIGELRPKDVVTMDPAPALLDFERVDGFIAAIIEA